PVARAAHGGVVAAGDRDELARRLLRPGGPVDGLADRADGRRRGAVAGGVDRHRAVLDERAGRQAGDVVEDPGGVTLGGAERRPVLAADEAVGEGGLGPHVVGDVGRDRGDAVEAPTLSGREGDLTRLRWCPDGPVGDEDDGGQARHGERHGPVRVRRDGRVVPVQGGVGRARGQRGEGRGRVRRLVVEGDDVLDLRLPVHPGEGVDAVGGVQLDLGSFGQRRVARAGGGELGDVRVERDVGGVVVLRPDRRAVERLLVLVLLYLTGEERLAGLLVTALPDKSLRVAVVDDRLAAGEVHEGEGQT